LQDRENFKDGNEIVFNTYDIQIEGQKMREKTPLKQVNTNTIKTKSKRKKHDDDDDDDDIFMDEKKGNKQAKLNALIASSGNSGQTTAKFRYTITIITINIIIITIILVQHFHCNLLNRL
jgi:hypothetical protein